jgi:hypothetical protein
MLRRISPSCRNVHLRLVLIPIGSLDCVVHWDHRTYPGSDLASLPQVSLVIQIYMWGTFIVYLSVFAYLADWCVIQLHKLHYGTNISSPELRSIRIISQCRPVFGTKHPRRRFSSLHTADVPQSHL